MLNVHLRITDAATGRPTPVRVRVTAPDGTHFPPLGRAAEFPAARNADVGGHLWVGREKWWYIDGTCELPLPAGVPLRVQVAKGPEFVPLDETVTLGAGQIALRFALARWIDSRAEGWASVDTRCHFLTPHAALLEAEAEGVTVANLLATPFPVLALDANTYTTTPNLLAFSGQVPALERNGCSVVVNTFNAHPVLGKVALLNSHRPVFPLAFGGEDSDDWGVCDWCDQCHRKKGLTVWVDAFESGGGLVGAEALVAALLGKIDAIEVSAEPRKTPLLPWVYRLWDAGYLLPLVGASGKDSNRSALGSMRTYARVKEEDPPPQPPPCREGEKGSLTSPLEGEVGEALRAGWGVKPYDGSDAPPTRRVQSDAATSPSRGEVNTNSPLPSGRGVGGVGSWIEAIRAGRTFVTAGPLLALTHAGDRFRAVVRSRGKVLPVEIVADGLTVAAGAGEVEATIAGPGWVAARCSAQGSFAHTSPVAVGVPARKPEAAAALRALVEQTREWVEIHGRFANPKRKQAILDRASDALRVLGDLP